MSAWSPMSSGAPPRQRRSWLGLLIVVLLIAIPIAEVYLLVQVGRAIGALPTIAILVAEAVLGAWLMQREGSRAWAALNTAFASGKLPSGELADAALVLVGGLLLMLPGFITDIFGFVFLLAFTRPYARRVLGFIVARRVARLGVDVDVMRARTDPGNLIEGEVVEPSDTPPSTHDSRADDSGPLVIRGEIESDPDRKPSA
ncbi:MAG TPA: FxsA family protein [Microlunatus sp.]|nr:FxsA family protein [Microlunatus sp.]